MFYQIHGQAILQQHLNSVQSKNRVRCYSLQSNLLHHCFLKMKFENIMAEVNGFGKFQLRIVLLMAISRSTMPFHFLLNNFIGVVPSHHCDITSLDDGGVFRNLSQAERMIVTIPVQDDGTPNACQMFAEPQYHLLKNSTNITGLPIVPCWNGWTYDNTTFTSTLATTVSVSLFHAHLDEYEHQISCPVYVSDLYLS